MSIFELSHWPFSRGILKNTQNLISQCSFESNSYAKCNGDWRLYFLLYSITNALTVFGIAINRKFHEIND